MVVGDDAQSIFAWRGAEFTNIYEFPKRYPEAETYKLETNYRSTPEILGLANVSIAHNRKQFVKLLRAVSVRRISSLHWFPVLMSSSSRHSSRREFSSCVITELRSKRWR
jgi:DNA helicase-2/ATP-dependent DNA helicase PcrA